MKNESFEWRDGKSPLFKVFQRAIDPETEDDPATAPQPVVSAYVSVQVLVAAKYRPDAHASAPAVAMAVFSQHFGFFASAAPTTSRPATASNNTNAATFISFHLPNFFPRS